MRHWPEANLEDAAKLSAVVCSDTVVAVGAISGGFTTFAKVYTVRVAMTSPHIMLRGGRRAVHVIMSGP
jgi:hypothetical protein